MGNIHFTEIFDFFIGWLTLDFSGDDWATSLADEQRAVKGKGSGKPEEPATGPAADPPKEPPKAPPPEPAKEPPPKKPKKPAPPRSRDYDLRDIIP